MMYVFLCSYMVKGLFLCLLLGYVAIPLVVSTTYTPHYTRHTRYTLARHTYIHMSVYYRHRLQTLTPEHTVRTLENILQTHAM